MRTLLRRARRWLHARFARMGLAVPPARFRAVLVGCESGDRHPISLITFPDEPTARAWCEQTNRGNHFGLTRWEWEPLPAE